MDFNVNS